MFRVGTRSGLLLAFAAVLAGAVGAAAATSTTSGTPQNGVNGVFRVTWTKQQLIAAGAPSSSASDVTLTLTLKNGHFRFQIKQEPSLRCTGGYSLYTFKGSKRISISFNNPTTCPEINAGFNAVWSRSGGNLRFQILVTHHGEPGDKILFGHKVWQKVG